MGREFVDLFERWASTYDQSVTGNDVEYKEVFQNYEGILQAVADRALGPVLEFGVGTGNLTERLVKKGYAVYGAEPSTAMREIAHKRLSEATIVDGDFLTFPSLPDIRSIVSTYAFHHLTDEEKDAALKLYGELLPSGGKVIFADTSYETEAAKEEMIEKARANQYLNLVNDLNTEYYTTLKVLETLCTKHGFDVSFSRFNQFVWLMEATKR